MSVERGDRFLGAGCVEGLARIALTSGRPARAAQLFSASEMLRAPLGWRRSVAAQVAFENDLASMRTVLGDVAFAAAWTEGGTMTFERAVEYALASTETPRRVDQGSKFSFRQPGELSPRERAVAALIVEGKTNREIAASLAIRETTAETHVQHILNKLSFNSRAQIAAWAISHGLVIQ